MTNPANVIPQWSNATLVFYIIVSLVAALLVLLPVYPNAAQREARGSSSIGFVLSALLLILFKGFAVNPTDVAIGYRLNFESATSWQGMYDSSLEPGFRLLIFASRAMSESYGVFLVVAATLTIAPVYYVVWKWRDSVDSPTAIAAFAFIFLFPSLSILRISIAASITFLAFQAITRERMVLALVLSAVATTFHATAFIFFVLGAFWILRKRPRMLLGLGIFLTVLFFNSMDAVSTLFVGRYSVYSIQASTASGFGLILRYAPPLFAFFILARRAKEDLGESYFNRFFFPFVFVLVGAVFELISYNVSIFGRLVVFTVPSILFFGSAAKQARKSGVPGLVVWLLLHGALIFRFVIFMEDYYEIDSLMPYVSIFGHIL